MKRLIFTLIFVLLGVSVEANQFVFGPSLSYRSHEVNNSGSVSETSTLWADTRVGMILSSSIYVGGMYSLTTTSSGSSKEDRTALGASIGYFKSAVLLNLTYFVTAQHELSTATRKGTGFQLDFGYHFDAGSFMLGPMLSYKKLNYTTSESAGVETTIDRQETLMEPYLSFLIQF